MYKIWSKASIIGVNEVDPDIIHIKEIKKMESMDHEGKLQREAKKINQK